MPEQPIIPGLEDYQRAKEEEIAKAEETNRENKKIIKPEQKPSGVQMTIDQINIEDTNQDENLSPSEILHRQAEELRRKALENASDDEYDDRRKDIFG